MKIFRRFQVIALAVVMAVMTLGTTTAFAAENTTEDAVWVKVDDVEITSPNSDVFADLIADDTWNINGTHTGVTRKYNYSYLDFGLWMYAQDGSSLPSGSTILAIRLYDDTSGGYREWQTSSEYIFKSTVELTYGHKYHFEYLVAYGTPALKLHMQIWAG